ncbi:glycosyltransferase family 4 protein [Latilactobacillus curvatus]|uniref:Glucosyltransferase n=1 Tax=Latilactobacillus curvatus JCM 1096 = DSM 20019 TaxID=1293592 RepID=A0AAJ0LEE3_LATCU|nr:glycosyltransferase family 4 protein [Latilactobacillus curvatus]KRK92001.1 glucosyltransferase [Latilactobacillus curvatus JCM 1096 = DSM 20019]MCT3530819.1 glycosyltransferase family 1 protein [Latilactobacillus curvatus]MDG2988978.1 glycosyltransferase family 4 protein [Latilactobacillus curvatus]QAS49901.1 glycosyltransferase family 1 protein [Latilactobacillus curvatus JCM 1096 = DSM 20019]UTB75662.1 glycosyl transferase family 1 [Latilactobacillus curvatus]
MKTILYLHAGSEMYGADKILLEIVTGIDKKKYMPIVVLPSEGILAEKLRENEIETYIIDYPILRRKYFNPKGILQYISQYRHKSNEIEKIVKKRNISIIHVNTAAVLEGITLKRKLSTKIIWHIHEIILKPKIINYLLSYLIGKYSDEVLVVSKAVKKHLLSTNLIKEDKIKVLYNGVENNEVSLEDTEYLYDEFNIEEDTLKIGMVGRINAWKGQDDFLKAVEPVLRFNPKAHAFLVGGVFSGEEWRKEELKKAISESSVKNRIHFSDFRNDTQELFEFFDIFVLPSTNPDPLPTVVLEAMSAGKPVIGYRHGGVKEMVIDEFNGLLVNVKNTKLLSEAICILSDDSDKRKLYGDRSLQRQRELYSISGFITNVEELYSQWD